MKYKLIILISFFSINNCFGIENYSKNDTLISWAEPYLNLRENPSLKSNIIQKILPGEKLIVIKGEISENCDNQNNTLGIEDLKLCGNWIKIRSDNKIGFVDNSYLSRLIYPDKMDELQIKNEEFATSCLNLYLIENYPVNSIDSIYEKNERSYQKTYHLNSGVIIKEIKFGLEFYFPELSYNESLLILKKFFGSPKRKDCELKVLDEILMDKHSKKISRFKLYDGDLCDHLVVSVNFMEDSITIAETRDW